jgi:hypothetical protein
MQNAKSVRKFDEQAIESSFVFRILVLSFVLLANPYLLRNHSSASMFALCSRSELFVDVPSIMVKM